MSEQKEQPDGKMNFFQRLLENLFFRNSDPEVEKKRLMKSIAKTLSKTKYKFYKYGSEEVLPAFAKTFFTIYKTVVPGRIYFQSNQNPKLYQKLVINTLLPETHLDLIDQLSEQSITENARTIPIKQLKIQVKEKSDTLFAFFDSGMINRIDSLYSQLMLFKAFCEYDYFFLLKKFSSSIRENDFNTVPQFESIVAKYIVDDLKDFMSVAWGLTDYNDWSDLFMFLKKVKNTDTISKGTWTRLMNRLQDMRASRVFEMMIQLIQQNPGYEYHDKRVQEHITEKFVDAIRQEAENTLLRIQKEQKSSKIDTLVAGIFGTTSIVRMKYYTEELSHNFERRGVGSLTYQQPMNYMKAFLLDYIKKDVREMSDLILVRGQWTTTTLSTPMSEAYHRLLELSTKITEFDDILSDTSPTTAKIKNLLTRCERDKEALNIIRTLLKDINTAARNLLISGTQDLITFAKNMKMVLEDYAKTHHELIMNWKELEHFADYPIKETGVGIYKKLHQFATLMKGFLEGEAE